MTDHISELWGWAVGITAYGMAWAWFARRDGLGWIHPFKGLWLASVFVILPLSHFYHLLWPEISITDYCASYAGLLDQPSCIASLGAGDGWASPYLFNIEGALVNSWEITVAWEVFILKLLAAATVMLTASSWNQITLSRRVKFAPWFAGFLALDGLVGLVLFSNPGSNHDTLTWIGLVSDMLILGLVMAVYGGPD